MNENRQPFGPRLEVEEFRLLRDLINKFCGIAFADDYRYIMERRLRDRLGVLGMATFQEYYQYLKYHPNARAELEEAVDSLTTNETYFFREEYQLRSFRDEVLPELLHRLGPKKKLAIWSAGCSTGEEAYTIAMLILDARRFEDWDVRIFGNDISRRVLAHARRGVYGSGAFRATTDQHRRAYFVDRSDGMHVVEEVHSLCHFGHLNLLDEERAAFVGRVDVIFCRNVLIYFDSESRRRVIELFYDRLAPGGYLFLGHSESLINLSTAFELVHLREDLVYRKPDVEASPNLLARASSASRPSFDAAAGLERSDGRPTLNPELDRLGRLGDPALGTPSGTGVPGATAATVLLDGRTEAGAKERGRGGP